MIELLIAIVLFVSAVGIGRYLLRLAGVSFRNGLEELSFSAVSGLGLLAYQVLLLGLAHLLYATVIHVLLAVWAVFGLFETYRMAVGLKAPILRMATRSKTASSFYTIIAGFAAIAFLFGVMRSLAPPHGATDPLAYQLALPKIFLLKHYLSFEPTITGALYPSFIGILFLVGISLQNGILAQLIQLFIGVLCVAAICAFGRTYFSLRVGIWAGTIFSFVPIFVVFGSQGYVDVGLCFFQFMAFWALINWLQRLDRKMLVLAGLSAGLALGTKHQGMPTLLLGTAAILVFGMNRKSGVSVILRNAGMFIAAAAIVVGPWYIRGYVQAGNPIWPMGNSLFSDAVPFGRLPTFGGVEEKQSFLFRVFIPPWNWFQVYWNSMSPWAWTFSPNGWQKAIGVYFISVVPGIFFFKRCRLTTALILFCGVYYVILIRFLHMNPRYALVLFAFLSVLAGIVAEHLSTSQTTGIAKVFKVAFVATLCLNLTWCFTMARSALDVAMGRESREHFLQKTESNYGLYKFVNDNLDENALVLLQGIVRGYYCDRAYMWDHPHQDVLRYERHRTSEELYAKMNALRVTHVARMIHIPPSRTYLGYPQYFSDDLHEDFRKKYLRLLWRDQFYALFSLVKTG